MNTIPFRKFDPPSGSMLFDIRYNSWKGQGSPPECFEVVYYDGLSKQLEVVYIEPIIDIWFLNKDDRDNKYQLPQVEMDRCYKVRCKPSQIAEKIAEEIGGVYKQEYETMKAGEVPAYKIKEAMCECPWVFKADLLPDVYLRLEWMKRFGDIADISNVSFGILDIEVDVIADLVEASNIDTPDKASQPINAASLIFPTQKFVSIHILGPRPKFYFGEKFHELLDKQTKEWEWLQTHQNEFIEIIKGKSGNVQLEHYNIEFDADTDNEKYIGDYEVKLHLYRFEHELSLIEDMFKYINKYRPMFMLSWNATFDDNYILQRIYGLGGDPYEIMIPKEFKTEQIYFAKDKSTQFNLKQSRDFFYLSSYTQFLCHLRTFAAIRKSQQERRSYSLSSIGREIAGIDKLTSTKSGSFRTFPYTDFLKFILYNVRDVVVELAIELKCQDCKSLVSRSYMFATQYSKCFQETHIVRNAREWYFENQGYVQACRLEIDSRAEASFKGAFVAPPENNLESGLILLGKLVNFIMYGVLDADAAAYYPSAKMANNMDPMSLHFKCEIDNSNFARGTRGPTNRSFNQEYSWFTSKGNPQPEDMTGPIFNSFKNDNIYSLMYNWLNVPSITEVFAYVNAHLSD